MTGMKKPRMGYQEISMFELYDVYLICWDNPDMITIMQDFSGTRNVTPLIKIFEEWRLNGEEKRPVGKRRGGI